VTILRPCTLGLAALVGLLLPAAVDATEIPIEALNRYSPESSADQVTSISQFSDVKPTDWAYQALSNLIERYGCVAGYPSGSFKGGQAMTRYEAAALLNACLDRISEVTDELKRLMKEFEKELAVLKGRVDGLEARVGVLEATQFSTTTKLTGLATFVVGSNRYSGNYRTTPAAALFSGFPIDSRYASEAAGVYGATSFNYDLRLNFDTSFTGKDLLRTQLRAGNFLNSAWIGNPPVGLSSLEVAFQEDCSLNRGPAVDCGDVVAINRLFYQFPIGSAFTATVGAKVRQDDMLAVLPGVYPADTILDVLTYYGAPGTYSSLLGSGAGLWWKDRAWSLSLNYIVENGFNGTPGPTSYPDGPDLGRDCGRSGGIATACSTATGTAQLAYSGSNYALAAAYTYSRGGAGLYPGNGTPLAVEAFGIADHVNSFGLSGYWQPAEAGWLPSISAGWGLNSQVGGLSGSVVSQSWSVGLQWNDAFSKGNVLGMGVGQPTFLTSNPRSEQPDGQTIRPKLNDGNYAWEWWYKLQVTDNISVTPAVYYLSAPLGQLQKGDGSSFNNFGGLVKTSFRF